MSSLPVTFTKEAEIITCYLACNNHNLIEALSLVDQYLSFEEKSYLAELQVDRRRLTYLLGRISAKEALQEFCKIFNPSSINIKPGVFGQPVVSVGDAVRVSISHSDHFGAALVFQAYYPMAIDIEEVNLERNDTIKSQLSIAEIELFNNLEHGYTMAWTIKEALSKVLKTGLTTPFLIYEISEIIYADGVYLAKFRNFPQYQSITLCKNKVILSLVIPYQLKIEQHSVLQLKELLAS